MSDLYETCKNAVNKRIWYKGTNGNERDPKYYGKPVEGFGFCTAYHDSHGLCIMVRLGNGAVRCVDPIEIEIMTHA